MLYLGDCDQSSDILFHVEVEREHFGAGVGVQ